jgi:para-nitrobenzyl esterase
MKIADPVRVTGGLLSGVDEAGGAVRAYKGIPFAAPPVGDFRWREPQPVRPWTSVRIADRFASVCTQPLVPRNAIMRLFSFDDPPECGMSEDCLYLNVWTGALSTEDKLPVIVWIFGGGHRLGGGSHPVSWGTSLAARGAVVVTLNYRVGALGFLAHPELTRESGASGNYGALGARQHRRVRRRSRARDDLRTIGRRNRSQRDDVVAARPRSLPARDRRQWRTI